MTRLAIAALALLPAIAAMGCSSDVVAPRVDLSEGLPAQRDFAEIMDVWDHGDWQTVLALGPRLEKHEKTHPKDPSALVARAMRALVALEKGDLTQARSLAQTLVSADQEGTTIDMARVVLASLERRQGRPQAALDALMKLFNKMIDAPTRTIVNRELVAAALAARKFPEAARFLRALLKQAGGPLRGFAEREMQSVVGLFPEALLLDLLRDEVASTEPDRWLSALLTQRLVEAVKKGQDPQLARSLLEVALGLLGQDADDVARVAAKGAGVRLERNTVGLLMPLRSDDHRRRGVEVAAGLALSLDLPGGDTRLVVRDDQRDIAKVDETLALLNADGAAVIVAGFDTREADIALAYAERTNVPILLLRPPSRPVPTDGTVFVLGESPGELRAELARGLTARGKKRIAMLVEERLTTDLPASVASVMVAEQPCGASLEFVRSSGADSLIVDGGPTCGSDALEGAGGVSLVFGFDAVSAKITRGSFASAGIYPVFGKTLVDPLLERHRARQRTDPSWWVGLGHDAGLLVKDAVLGLPGESDETTAAVAIRKRIVTDAVAKAEGPLWTTQAKGFDGKRVIARTVGLVDRQMATPDKRR